MELWRDKLQLRVRDKIQNAMEKFTRECLEMDAKSTDKRPEAAAKMDVVYERAAQLVSSTLDLDGCSIVNLDSFENTQVEGPDGFRTVYRADPYNTETDLLEKAQEFGPISALPLLASTDPARKTSPLSSIDHQRLSNFLSDNRDGKIYEHKPPSFVKGLFPDELRYAMGKSHHPFHADLSDSRFWHRQSSIYPHLCTYFQSKQAVLGRIRTSVLTGDRSHYPLSGPPAPYGSRRQG